MDCSINLLSTAAVFIFAIMRQKKNSARQAALTFSIISTKRANK
jgi:hypothetical protein